MAFAHDIVAAIRLLRYACIDVCHAIDADAEL